MRNIPGRDLLGRLGLVLGLAVGVAGCAAQERPSDASGDSSPTIPDTTVTDDAIQGTGTIRYVDLEGGFYGLVAEDGSKYDPTSSLPDSFQVDGLPVRFWVKEREVLTTRMWGTPVEVLRIEERDD